MAIYSEQVTNGDFSQGTGGLDGWSDASVSPGSVSVVGGKCLLQSGAGGTGSAEQTVNGLIEGATYAISFTRSGNDLLRVRLVGDGTYALHNEVFSSAGSQSFDFTMQGSSLSIGLENAGTSSESVEVDDVSLILKHSKWNGAVDDAFSNDGNWDNNAPGADTYAVWPAGNAADCSFDAAASVAGILAEDGYNGTIDAVDKNVSVAVDVELKCSGGTVSLGSGTWTIGRSFDAGDVGTLNRDTATATFTGTGNWIAKPLSASRFHLLRIADGADITVLINNASCTNAEVAGTLTVPASRMLTVYEGYLSVSGEVTGSGDIQLQGASSSGGITLLSGIISVGNLLLNHPYPGAVLAAGIYGCSVTVYPWSGDGDGAIVVLGSGSTVISGKLTIKSSTTGNRSVTFKTSGGTSLYLQGGMEFWTPHTGNAIFDNSDSSSTLTLDGEVTYVAGSGGVPVWMKGGGNIFFMDSLDHSIDFAGMTVDDIVVNKGGGTLTFSGEWTADSFEARNGTVDFGANTLETTGDFTVAAGAAIVAGTDAMNGASITVGGDCSLSGQANANLNLRGTAAWSLDISGTVLAEYCDVSYCDASAGTLVRTHNSVDSGNNLGWSFAVGGPYRTVDGEVFTATAAAGEIGV